MAADPRELKRALADCMGADRHRLSRRLAAATGSKAKAMPKAKGKPRKSPALETVAHEIQASVSRRVRRAERSLHLQFPDALPITEHVDEIKRLIADNQVVVVSGETGSGKSTQLPKICLALGRGIDGLVAHTQPRRIAARTLASRIASEMQTSVGDLVGYKVRFTDETGDDTAIKLVTDGMLLAEAQTDRFLNQYDTIIIDEAHERSLNIDFLLGILKQLLPRRPDLRVVITSATIDTERLSRHFDDAPVVEVSGRMFPVEVRYRSGDDDNQPGDLSAAVLDALEECTADGPGDVLVFLPGEREIRECRDVLSRQLSGDMDVLPLFSRLGRADQDRVFRTGPRRRVVLATNVAETSVTVPGIRYVIDSGLARISRYSPGRKVNRLPVEAISQASADQRKGRCGRIASGVCIRLYSEEDFGGRTEFTDPEILRSSLADVILRMLDMRLGDIDDFPFVDAPQGKQIRDGYRLLEELGAINDERRLTSVGKQLARLPVDPRIGRMLIAASKLGCLPDMLTIAAALAIADPRVTPFDRQQKARQQHRLLDDERSDFLTLLSIWKRWNQIAADESKRAARRFCEEHFLSVPRMFEWQDLRQQLSLAVKDIGMTSAGRGTSDAEVDADSVHQALLAGLLGNVANHLEKRDYMGTRSLRVAIHPSSVLSGKSPKWVIAAEMVETSALFARTAAPVKPQWIERAAETLATRSYSAPRWHKRKGRVMGLERVTLFGLTLVAGRSIDFGAVRPREARQVFIQEALVAGDLGRDMAFVTHNAALLEEVDAKEDRFRRRDLRVDDYALYNFYDERIPDGVYTAAALEQWLKDSDSSVLKFDTELVQRQDPGSAAGDDYPEQWERGDIKLALEYVFKPGDPADGVTALVPMDFLNQLDASWFDALVPGLLRDKLIAIIKALPKQLRTQLVPAPDTADAVLGQIEPGSERLRHELSRQIQRIKGVTISPDVWAFDALEAHLMMRFELIDGDGKTIAQSRNLASLKAEHGQAAATSFRREARFDIERDDVKRWDFGELPESVKLESSDRELIGFPALVEDGDHCAVRVFDSPEKARQLSEAGIRKLLLLELPGLRRMLERKLPGIDKLCLAYSPVGTCTSLKGDIGDAAFSRAIGETGYAVKTPDAFEQLKSTLKRELPRASSEVCIALEEIFSIWRECRARLDASANRLPQQVVDDVTGQIEGLVYTGFVSDTPASWLEEIPRFLTGALKRIDRAIADPSRDIKRLDGITKCLNDYKSAADGPAKEKVRWMIEELRVSIFSQELGTSMPISVRRIEKVWEQQSRG